MAAMLSAMDDQVGSLLEELDRHGIRENTLVFFMSDNGPSRQSRNWLDGRLDPYYGASTGPFRGHKFSLFEGGIRVPAIISWPARWPAGRTTDELAVGMDVLPTIAAAIGANPPGDDLDGRDLNLVLEGGATPHDVVYWEFGRQTAIWRGDWKLVLDGLLIREEPQADPVHLSNLREDPGETTNLAGREPEIANELHQLATSWRDVAEQQWADEHAARYLGPNAYAVIDTAGMALLADPTGPGAGDA